MRSVRFVDDWQLAPLHGLAQWTNGLAFREFQFDRVGKPVIKIAELKGGLSGQTKFTRQSFDASVHVSTGDMLFSWSGNPDTSIDVFWWKGPDGWLNQHIFKVLPAPGIDRVYFYYLLKYLKPIFTDIASNKQTTGLGHVTVADLRSLIVGVPSIGEQRAIARVLGPLDDKIELNRDMNETLEGMARALFKSWFIDFEPVRAKAEGSEPAGMAAETAVLFPDMFEDSEIGSIPKGWTVVRMPEVFDINPPRPIAKSAPAPYLEMGNMPTSSARVLGWEYRDVGSGMRFINGDTLVARITPCLENGKTAFVDFLEEGQSGWGSTEYIVIRSKPPLPVEYAYFLVRSDDFRSHAIQNMTGTSGRQRVPASAFDNYRIVRPSSEVSRVFGDFASKVFATIKAHDDESATLSATRDALLPKLLSGDMRVQEADKVVEAALA